MSVKGELETRHLEICPDGDMEIVLPSPSDNITYRYTVTSYQLCACSSVFRAMLGPKSSFAEAVELRRRRLLEPDSPDSDGLYQLELEDHDPTALSAVLNVVHARTENLPDKIPFEGLLQVAIICDYFDCAAAMRPWDEFWMKPHKENAQNPGFESWLFIAQVFKEETVFRNLSSKLVRNSIVDDGEFKVLESKEPGARVVKRLPNHSPHDALLKQREILCEQLAKIYREAYDRYEDTTKIQCTYDSSPGNQMCDYFIFGVLHKELKSSGLLTEVNHYDWTPEFIVATIQTIFDGMYSNLENYLSIDGSCHSDCISFRNILLARMRSTLDAMELSQPTLTAEDAASKERCWDNLLLPRNERRIVGEVEAEKS